MDPRDFLEQEEASQGGYHPLTRALLLPALLLSTAAFTFVLWHLLSSFSPLQSDAAIVRRARAKSVAPAVPSWIPFLGSALDFRRDPAAFLIGCRKRFGSAFRLNLGGRSLTFVTDPRDFHALIRSQDFSFDPVASEFTRTALGVDAEVAHGVGPGSGVDNVIHSQYVKYLASGEGLKELSDRSVKMVQKIIKRDFSSGSPTSQSSSSGSAPTSTSSGPPAVHAVQLYDWVKRVMFEAGIVSLYGQDFYDSDSEQLLKEFNAYDSVFPSLASNIPGAEWLFREGIKEGRDKLEHRLRQAAASEGGSPSSFIQARNDLFAAKKAVLRGASGRDNGPAIQLGVLWASQANTIPATFWTLFFLLADEKGAYEEILAEVQEHLGRRAVSKIQHDKNEEVGPQSEAAATTHPQNARKGLATAEEANEEYYDWSTEQLARCVKLDSAISETIRLTSGSFMMREAVRDTFLRLPSYAADDEKSGTGSELKGINVKKGERVLLLVSLTHMDEKLFPEPNAFKFDRFIQEKPLPHEAVKMSYLPFGAGRSLCPGRHWARYEIKALLAALILSLSQKPQLRLPPSAGGQHDASHEGKKQTASSCQLQFQTDRMGFGILPPRTDVEVLLQFSA